MVENPKGWSSLPYWTFGAATVCESETFSALSNQGKSNPMPLLKSDKLWLQGSSLKVVFLHQEAGYSTKIFGELFLEKKTLEIPGV